MLIASTLVGTLVLQSPSPQSVYAVSPPATDGSAGNDCGGGDSSCATAAAISTANNNDIIYVACATSDSRTTTSVTSSPSLTFTKRATQLFNSNNRELTTWSALWTSHGSITPTCNFSSSIFDAYIIGFGVSGTYTSSAFDPNGAVPAKASGNSNNPHVSISTSNADDLIVGLFGGDATVTVTAGTGFTKIIDAYTGQIKDSSEYESVTATQSSLNTAFSLSGSSQWAIVADALTADAPRATQPIKATFSAANGGSQQTVTVNSCSPAPTTLAGDGSAHNIVMDGTCAFTLSLPAGYQFTGGTGTTSCASGTCTEYDTTYDHVPYTNPASLVTTNNQWPIGGPDMITSYWADSAGNWDHGIFSGASQALSVYGISGTSKSQGAVIASHSVWYPHYSSIEYKYFNGTLSWFYVTQQMMWYNGTVAMMRLILNNTDSSSHVFNVGIVDGPIGDLSSGAPYRAQYNATLSDASACACITMMGDWTSSSRFISAAYKANTTLTSYTVGSDPDPVTNQLAPNGVFNDTSYKASGGSTIRYYMGMSWNVTVSAGAKKTIQIGIAYTGGTALQSGGTNNKEKADKEARNAANTLVWGTVVTAQSSYWSSLLSKVPIVSGHKGDISYFRNMTVWLTNWVPAWEQSYDGGTVSNSAGYRTGSPNKGAIDGQAYDCGYYHDNELGGVLPALYYNATWAKGDLSLSLANAAQAGGAPQLYCPGPSKQVGAKQTNITPTLAYLTYGVTHDATWLGTVYTNLNTTMNWEQSNRFNSTYNLYGWNNPSSGGGADDAYLGARPECYADSSATNVVVAPDATGFMIDNMRSFIAIATALNHPNDATRWSTRLTNTLSGVDSKMWSSANSDYFSVLKNGSLKIPHRGGKFCADSTVLLTAGLNNATRIAAGLTSQTTNAVLLGGNDWVAFDQFNAIMLAVNEKDSSSYDTSAATLQQSTWGSSAFLLWHFGAYMESTIGTNGLEVGAGGWMQVNYVGGISKMTGRWVWLYRSGTNRQYLNFTYTGSGHKVLSTSISGVTFYGWVTPFQNTTAAYFSPSAFGSNNVTLTATLGAGTMTNPALWEMQGNETVSTYVQSWTASGGGKMWLNVTAVGTRVMKVNMTNAGATWTVTASGSGVSSSYDGTTKLLTFTITYGSSATLKTIQISGATPVTETVTITMGAGPVTTITIGGSCSPSYVNNSFTTAHSHTFTANGGCAITFSTSNSTNVRYLFTSTTGTWRYTTTASGSETKSNTYYEQLQNTYTFVPHSPATWDAAYSQHPTGALLGVAAQNVCTASLSNGGGSANCSGYADYNTVVTLASFASSVSGTWTAQGTNTFQDTTGGNTHSVNFDLVLTPTTEQVTITMANGASPVTITVTGTGCTVGSFSADGSQHTFTCTGSSALTLTPPSNTTSLYVFIGAGHHGSFSWTTAAPGGTDTKSNTLNLLYSTSVSYSVAGGGSPTAPAVSFTQDGGVISFTLTMTPTTKLMDFGSTFTVSPNPLSPSSSSEQWYASSGTSGAPSAGLSIAPAFQHQYLLTMAASPSNCGTTAPSLGAVFEDAGATVGGISATPISGCLFTAWTGSGSGSYTGANNPTTITMNAAITETAGFSGTPQGFCTLAQNIVNSGSNSFAILASLFFVMAGGTVVMGMVMFTSKDASVIIPLAFVVLLLGTVIVLVAMLFGTVSVANNNTLYGIGCTPQ